MTEMQASHSDSAQHRERLDRRQFLLRSTAAAAGLILSGALLPGDVPNTAERVNPTTLAPTEPVYGTADHERETRPIVETMFGSVEEYLLSAEAIRDSNALADLDSTAQYHLFDRIGARLALGGSYQEGKWKSFAVHKAETATGKPLSLIPGVESTVDARYGMPVIDVARFAVLRTQFYAAAIPRAIVELVALSESSYVDGLSITAPRYEDVIDNGISDTIHRALIVDCMEGSERRHGVGTQWLRQYVQVLDAVISNTPDTFNDISFASLMPGMTDIDQSALDHPSKNERVYDITSEKSERFVEILSGKLILPGDASFASSEQAQQELLLRRIYGTLPDLPRDYFENLTVYRRTHEDQLPAWGGQLAT